MLVVASLARAQSVPKAAPGSDAQPVAVMLEQAIYQEETAGNLEAAAKTYRQIVEQAAVGRALVAQALTRLAALEVRQKQLDEARQTIERLRTEYPEQKDLIAKAEALLPNNGQKSAVVGGDQSNGGQQQNEHIPTAEEKLQAAELAKQGWQQYHDGKFDLAVQTFQHANQLDPKLIDAWNGLGWSNMNLRNPRPGGFDFARALALDPKNPMALNGMGWVEWRERAQAFQNTDDAVKYWQRALDADPTATSPMSGLAQSALDKNQFNEAIKWYEKWLSQEPKNADALLGLEHAKLGKTVIDEATDIAKAFFQSLDDDQISETHKFIVARIGASTRGQIVSGDADPSFFPGRRTQTPTLEEVDSAWDEFLKTYRSPMGKTVSRTLQSIRYSAPWRARGAGSFGQPLRLPYVQGAGRVRRCCPWSDSSLRVNLIISGMRRKSFNCSRTKMASGKRSFTSFIKMRFRAIR